MAGDRTLKVTILGDAKSVDRAFKETEQGAGGAEVKLDGFGRAFAKYAIVAGVAATATGLAANAMRAGAGAVGDYQRSIDLAERQLLGMTKSQSETAAALAIARAEADKGRGTYQDLAGAMAGLSSVARTAGLDLRQVTEIAEILAAVNPAEGLAGATFALREAASGDMTSIIERFNLSRATINRLRAEGVPAIEAVRRAMAEMGYDSKFLDEVNASTAKRAELLKGRLAELAAIGGDPIFDVLIKSVDKLAAALERPGARSFVEQFAREIETILAGNLLPSLGTSVAEVWYLAGAAFNDFIKAVSFDKLNIDEPLRRMRANIEAFGAGVKADTGAKFAEAVANNLSGKGGGPLAPERVRGYGAEALRAYLAGFDADQVGALGQFDSIIDKLFPGDANREAASRARATLAAAIAEIEQFGRISDGTFGQSEGVLGEYASAAGATTNTLAELTRVFGAQAPEVLNLLQLYRQQAQAQDAARLASGQLATAQDQLAASQQRAAEAARQLAGQVARFEGVAARHAAEAAGAVAAVNAEIAAVQRGAEDQARASSAAIEGLQGDLDALQGRAAANAAAAQAEQARAQAELAAIQERRREEAERLYATIVDGERRALDAANARVNQLSRQANREDLATLKAIQAARDAGNTREAARLTRQLEAQRKRRQGAMEIARAEAAVARDDFDAEDERAKREVAAIDAKAAKEEEAAKTRLGQIQEAAQQQAAADKAAIEAKQAQIKAIQDEQREQSRNAQDRQRQLQDEIAAIERRAGIQAAEDQARLAGARSAQSIGNAVRQSEVTHAGALVEAAQQMAGQKERERDAAKETFEWEERRLKLYEQYGVLPRQIAPTAPLAPPNPVVGPNAANLGAGGGAALRREWDGIVRGGLAG